jgi:HSP20 family protein
VRDGTRIEWRGHGKNDRNERPEKERALRYRRLSYRYTVVTGSALPEQLLEDLWQLERVRLLMETRWRPDADMYETASAFEIVVDLAGIGDDDFEVQLFEDALVVEGQRQLRAPRESAVYHAASIRQGPFRLNLPLPGPIDADRVEAHYDRGILRVTLPKDHGGR